MFTKDGKQDLFIKTMYQHIKSFLLKVTIVCYISRVRIIATEVYKALNELSLKYVQDIIEKNYCDYNLQASLP